MQPKRTFLRSTPLISLKFRKLCACSWLQCSLAELLFHLRIVLAGSPSPRGQLSQQPDSSRGKHEDIKRQSKYILCNLTLLLCVAPLVETHKVAGGSWNILYLKTQMKSKRPESGWVWVVLPTLRIKCFFLFKFTPLVYEHISLCKKVFT